MGGPAFEPILGRYLAVKAEGVDYRIFVEEAGQGAPLVCLHTAGADSRQYHPLMSDPAVTSRFRVIAFDLPWHGRSDPPDNWWLSRYALTTNHYLAIIRAVWMGLGLERPVFLGCSMAGGIVLRIASDYQGEVRGVVGLESAAHVPGRYNDFLHHPAVHGGELVATYTYGLNAPMSPETARRRNWWCYAQGGPGVYRGDILFYSLDFDAREAIRTIDTNRCKVALLTGAYDYACTPAMTREVAAAIPGARFTEMADIGHFPMIENYPRLSAYLMPELERMLEG